MEVVRGLDGSVLWLSSASDGALGNLRKEAQLRGLDPDRLIFARRVARNDQHLGASARRPVPRYGAPAGIS
jgi:predicted O-linked N-acetylglucosamine transferase (SPINDLY family)